MAFARHDFFCQGRRRLALRFVPAPPTGLIMAEVRLSVVTPSVRLRPPEIQGLRFARAHGCGQANYHVQSRRLGHGSILGQPVMNETEQSNGVVAGAAALRRRVPPTWWWFALLRSSRSTVGGSCSRSSDRFPRLRSESAPRVRWRSLACLDATGRRCSGIQSQALRGRSNSARASRRNDSN